MVCHSGYMRSEPTRAFLEEVIMNEQNYTIDSSGGRAVQTSNLFLHTLGSDPKTRPDFGEFLECRI